MLVSVIPDFMKCAICTKPHPLARICTRDIIESHASLDWVINYNTMYCSPCAIFNYQAKLFHRKINNLEYDICELKRKYVELVRNNRHLYLHPDRYTDSKQYIKKLCFYNEFYDTNGTAY